MGAITSLAQLNAACRPPVIFGTTSAIFGASASIGQPYISFGDIFRQTGLDGTKAAGVLSAAGASASLTSSSVGALPIPAVSSGQSLYIAGIENTFQSNIMTNFGTVYIADLLTQQGFDPNSTSLQTLSAVSLPRGTGTSVEMWLFFPGIVSNAVNMTINYVNSSGNAKTGVIAIPSGLANFRAACIPLWFDSSDPVGGCNSITSVQLSSSLAASGSWSLFLVRRLCSSSVLAMAPEGKSSCFTSLGLPKLYDFGASQPCLTVLAMNQGSGSSWFQGQIQYAVA